MLFDFHQEQPTSFWMKNTYVPLDMIFIRADGRILRIAENTGAAVGSAGSLRRPGAWPCSKWWPAPPRSSASRPATASRIRSSAAASAG